MCEFMCHVSERGGKKDGACLAQPGETLVGGELINFLKKKISKKIFLSGDFIDMRMLSNCPSVLFRKKKSQPIHYAPVSKKNFFGTFLLAK